MADTLAKNGIYFDELNKIRVLETEVSQQTNDLKEECKDFVEKITEFQKIADGFILMVDTLAKEVEKEKMKAIGARNLLKSVAKQREAEQQQLQAGNMYVSFTKPGPDAGGFIQAETYNFTVGTGLSDDTEALIIEKSTELERLGIQLQSLQKTELEQQEIIEHLVLHR